MYDDLIRIVISYRRDDSAGYAGRLYENLAERFGEDQVFIDVDAIEPGLDFAEVITSAINSADVLVAMIGTRWLTATDRHGRRRIDLDDDYVRLEIESAIRGKLRILPVLVGGAEMPSERDLPPSLAAFSRRHALELSDKRWRDDMTELIELLEDIAEASTHQAAVGRARPGDAEYDRELGAAHEAAGERAHRKPQMVQSQPGRIHEPVSPVGPPAADQPIHSATAPPARARSWLVAVLAVVLLLAVVGAVVVVHGGGKSGNSGDKESVSATSITTVIPARTVEVHSDVPWNDTGIDVVAGQSIEVVATGKIETWKGFSSSDSGPDGRPGEEYANNVILGFRHGALIGMIGQRGEPFEIGANKADKTAATGRLYLGVNDRGVENNAGSYRATITVRSVA